MCSEGSLNDVLYAKEEAPSVRESVSFITSSLRVSRANRSNSLRASETRSSAGKKSGGGTGTGVYQYVYALPWSERLELALGAAQGVAALVAALPGTSHNDIKSANYLVDCPKAHVPAAPGESQGGLFSFMGMRSGTNKSPASDSDSSSSSSVSITVNSPAVKFVVKLADVEFASAGDTPAHMTRGETPNWTAPEVLSGEATVSPASDMYALANVLYEIAVRETPFGSTPGGDSQVKKLIIDGRRPVFPDPSLWPALERAETSLNDGTAPPFVAEAETASRQEFVAIVGRAWAPDPNDRPTAADLVDELQQLHDTFTKQANEEREKMRRSSLLPFKAQAATPPPQVESDAVSTATTLAATPIAGTAEAQLNTSFNGSLLPDLAES